MELSDYAIIYDHVTKLRESRYGRRYHGYVKRIVAMVTSSVSNFA